MEHSLETSTVVVEILESLLELPALFGEISIEREGLPEPLAERMSFEYNNGEVSGIIVRIPRGRGEPSLAPETWMAPTILGGRRKTAETELLHSHFVVTELSSDGYKASGLSAIIPERVWQNIANIAGLRRFTMPVSSEEALEKIHAGVLARAEERRFLCLKSASI